MEDINANELGSQILGEAPNPQEVVRPVDPNELGKQFLDYQPKSDTENRLEQSHKYYSENADKFWGQGSDSWLVDRVPGANIGASIANYAELGRAIHEMKGGQPSDNAINVIAQHRARQEYEAKKGYGESAVDAITHVPGIAAEFAATGGLASAGKEAGGRLAARAIGEGLASRAAGYAAGTAVQAAAMPSMYLDRAVNENIQKDRDPLDPRGLPGAYGLAVAQNAVLGVVGKMTGSALQGPGLTRAAGRIGVQAVTGPIAQAATDAVTSAVGLDTGYGTIGQLIRKDYQGAAKSATMQAMQFAAFGAAHEAVHPQTTMSAYQKALQDMASRGMPADAAGNALMQPAQVLADLHQKNPNPSQADVMAAMKVLPEGPVRDWGEAIARTMPDRAPEEVPGNLELPKGIPTPESSGTPTAPSAEASEQLRRQFAPEAQGPNPGIDELPETSPQNGNLQKQIDYARYQRDNGPPENKEAWQKRLDTLWHIDAGTREVPANGEAKEATPPSTEPPEARKSRLYTPEPVPAAQEPPERLKALQTALDDATARARVAIDPVTRRRWEDRAQALKEKVDASTPNSVEQGVSTETNQVDQKTQPQSLLERMRSKQQDVATHEQRAQVARKLRSFTDYNPPTEYERAGLTKDEAYIHDQLVGKGRTLEDIAKDPILKTMNSKQAVAAASLRASAKLGKIDVVTGKPKSAKRLLAERAFERSRFAPDGSEKPAEITKEAIENYQEELAKQGTYLSDEEARADLKTSAWDLSAKENAYQSLWTEYYQELKKHGINLTPAQHAELDAKAGRGEDPPASSGKKSLARQRKAAQGAKRAAQLAASVRPADDSGVRGDLAQRPAAPVAQDAGGKGLSAGANADQSAASGNELIPEATKKMLADAAASGNKWYLEQLKKELLGLYDADEVKEAIAEVKNTPRSEDTAKSFEMIKSVGRGQVAQANAMIRRGEIRDELIRHTAGKEYESVIAEGQKTTIPAQTIKELAEQIRSENQASGEAESIQDIARETGHDPEELADLLSHEHGDTSFDPESLGSPGEPAAGAVQAGNGDTFDANIGANGQPKPGAPLGRGLVGKILDAVHDESGSVNLDVLKAKWQGFVKKVQSLNHDMGELAGRSFPRTAEASRPVAEAMNEYVAATLYSKGRAERLVDKVLTNDTVPQQEFYGSAFYETRARYAKREHLEEAKKLFAQADVALRAGNGKEYSRLAQMGHDEKDMAATVRSFIGKDLPLKTEADYQAAQPGLMERLERYAKEVVPEMEANFKSAVGMDENEDIQTRTQIPNYPMNAISVDPESPIGNGVYKVGTSRGNLFNQRQKSLGFDKQATLAADAYDLNFAHLIENSIRKGTVVARQAEMFRTAVEEGQGRWGRRGLKEPGDTEFDVRPPKGQQVTQNGDPLERNETSFYAKEAIADDLYKALDLGKKMSIPVFTDLSNLATKGSIFGTVEATVHTANNLTQLIKNGVNPFKFFTNGYKLMTGDAEARDRLVELARINADKDFTPGSKYNPGTYTAKWLHLVGQAARLTMDDAFTSLTKRPDWAGGVEDNPQNRTDFINQLGNYNKRSQQQWVAWLRDVGLGPFATAGTNFAAQGLKSLVGAPGVTARTAGGQIFLHAENLGKVAALIGSVALANYLRWGRVDGDDNTPFLAMKIGQDEQGKTSYIDPVSVLTPFKRGLREVGALAMIEGARRGDNTGKSIDRAADAAMDSFMHPILGPAYNVLHTAATGKDFIGRDIAPKAGYGESQKVKNVETAAWNAIPAVGMLAGKDRPETQERPMSERLMGFAGPFGVKYAGPHAPPEVTDFYDRLDALQNKQTELSKAAHAQGQQIRQDPLLTVFHQAAIDLGKLRTAINSPVVSQEKKAAMRQQQARLAQRLIDLQKQYEARQKIPAK